jgi:hypothetical protein
MLCEYSVNRVAINREGSAIACGICYNYDDLTQHKDGQELRKIDQNGIVIREILGWISYI